MDQRTLFEKTKAIHSSISTDAMGGSPLDKCYMMAYLAQRLNLKTFVEIGVFRGKSLFSVAPAFIGNGGHCYGIDPWFSENLKENDLPDDVKKLVDDFARSADFNALYNEVIELRQKLDMDDAVTLLRRTAEDAYDYFNKHFFAHYGEVEGQSDREKAFIDMLHIDGNHDYEYVIKDVQLYIPLVRTGGIIVFDDVSWTGVRRAYDSVKDKYVVLFENEDFAVLYKDEMLADEMRGSEYSMPSWSEVRLLRMSLPALCENVHFSQEKNRQKRPLRVMAAVMTYNSSAWIEECIQSIAVQQGEFLTEICIFDDASSDDTVVRVENICGLPKNVCVKVYRNSTNEGYEKNYLRVLGAFEKSCADFLTCIDGDDYLLSPLRFTRNTDELLRRPECALSFDRLMYYYQDQESFALWNYQDALTKDTYTARELAAEYFIGNGSCSTVRRNAAVGIPDELFSFAKIGDWLIHCIYASKGDIAYIREPMNVYRKHDGGVWSGISEDVRIEKILKSIAAFNQTTDYLFYESLYNKMAAMFQSADTEDIELYDLTIIDDVFPHPSSGFRYEEFLSYLKNFENMRILCNGSSDVVLGKRTHTDILAEFKQTYPEFADKLVETRHQYELQVDRRLKSKLAYFCFLGNAYTSLDIVERNRIPFVFELYPGGSFQLDTAKSDAMLERVLRSPCFCKVIVTQDVTRDYLLQSGLCSEEQIVSIFGVVTPQKALNTVPVISDGGDGSVLRVCFAAMRYALVHEFIELRFICIQFGKTVNFYWRVFRALYVFAGGVLGYSELLADGIGAFSTLCFFPYHENRSTP